MLAIEIQEVDNGGLAVPAYNTLVCYISFLAADTQLCILMIDYPRLVPSTQ